MKKEYSVQKLIDLIVAGMQDIKAKNISILDLRETESSICDYFVICDAESSTQVNAIANSVEKKVMDELKDKPVHTEGFENASWVLVDYGDVIVHVFQTEIRMFYDIEGFWENANRRNIPDNGVIY